MRHTYGIAALLTLSMTACTSISTSEGAASSSTTSSVSTPGSPSVSASSPHTHTAPGSVPSMSALGVDLSAAGINIVSDEVSAEASNGFVITEAQAANLAHDADRHDGL